MDGSKVAAITTTSGAVGIGLNFMGLVLTAGIAITGYALYKLGETVSRKISEIHANEDNKLSEVCLDRQDKASEEKLVQE
jgi:hypothetical protein